MRLWISSFPLTESRHCFRLFASSLLSCYLCHAWDPCSWVHFPACERMHWRFWCWHCVNRVTSVLSGVIGSGKDVSPQWCGCHQCYFKFSLFQWHSQMSEVTSVLYRNSDGNTACWRSCKPFRTQLPTRIGADVLDGRLSGNLCHCWQATPAVCWHRDTVSTKNKDHAGDEEFHGRRSSHLEQFTCRPANRNSLAIDVRSTSVGPPVWLIVSASEDHSINQSIFICIRQPEPIVTRPIHINTHTHNTVQNLQHRREKRETKPLLERDICCRRSHQYFSAISSNRGKAN